jgi:hypothetical protein
MELGNLNVGRRIVKRLTLISTLGGAALIALGIVVVGSTVGHTGDQEMRMGGLLAMSFGGMVVAVPLYFQARRLQTNRVHTALRKGKVRGATRCATCGMETAMFWCTTHTVRLCADCVPAHDDGNRCLYRSLVHSGPVAAKR